MTGFVFRIRIFVTSLSKRLRVENCWNATFHSGQFFVRLRFEKRGKNNSLSAYRLRKE